MGIDPVRQPVEFDISDPAFVKAYFEVLHHPYETMGVDFWWLDWQQGLDCKIPSLDPLWLINHLHFRIWAVMEPTPIYLLALGQ